MKWCNKHQIFYETERHYMCIAEDNKELLK